MNRTLDESTPEWELQVQVPPGWIEFVAHNDEQAALAAFDELLEPHHGSLRAEEADRLRRAFAGARHLSVGASLRIGGAVLTLWEDGQPTVWYYGVWTFGTAGLDGVNPVGLLERGLGWTIDSDRSLLSSMLTDARQEDFDLIDGRVGSSLHATLRSDLLPRPPDLDDVEVPADIGLVLAAVPLPGLPDVAALIIGVSPTLEQRAAMSMFASVMAHSVHVVGEGVADVPTVEMTLDQAFGDERSAKTAR